jgi:predicted metal-dependent hydrolase
VNRYLGRIEDPALRGQVRGFFGQEGRHAKEHERVFACWSGKDATATLLWQDRALSVLRLRDQRRVALGMRLEGGVFSRGIREYMRRDVPLSLTDRLAADYLCSVGLAA